MTATGQVLQQRYKVDRQIGQGGMGSVYVATDERFGSVVAIKETLCMDDNYRKALEREARLLNSLKHQALPRVTDHFIESNGQFLVMEYIPGEDLSVILDERKEPFSIDEVLGWADQLLDALVFLHGQENPVIHRDIKPQNLKLTLKGQIILLDFGLAKGNVTGAENNTNAKSIFGYSRNYASLEQIQGTGTDPRSDLYSLAATLYHLLTGLPPEDALTRAMAVLTQQPDPLIAANAHRSEIPSGVAYILQRALALDPAGRPSNAAEMKQMLREHTAYASEPMPTTAPAPNTATNFHSRDTELMPITSGQVAGRATQAQTEILSDGSLSQVTRIRPLAAAPTATGNGRSPFKMTAAVAAAGLLLLGCAVAGVLFYGPALMGKPVTAEENNLVAEPVGLANTANVIDNSAGSSAAVPAPEAGSDHAAAPDTQKKDVTKSTAKTEAKSGEELNIDDQVVVNSDEVRVGNMRITKGKIILPDGTTHNLDQDVDVPNPPDVPELSEDARRHLTPDQLKQLRALRQRSLQMQRQRRQQQQQQNPQRYPVQPQYPNTPRPNNP